MKSAARSIGDSVTATQYNDLRADAYAGSFLLPHAQSTPDLTLKIEAGVVYVGGTRVKYAGGNSPSFTAPAANPRIDLLTIDNAGTVARTAGVEAASPSVPTYPTDKVVLCEVFNRVGQTVINDADAGSNGYISADVRPHMGSALDLSQVDRNILPKTDNTYTLGSASFRWSEVRAVSLFGDGTNLTGLPAPYDYQSFTANGTWTKPASVKTNSIVLVMLWGGGGAGGGVSAGSVGGAGGGGGGCIMHWARASALGATESVTVGAAVAGTSGTGSAGNNSTFNAFVGYGGGGGAQTNAGGTGGGQGGCGNSQGSSGSGTTPGSGAGHDDIYRGGQGSAGGGGTASSGIWGGGGGGGGSNAANSGSNGGTSVYGGGGGGGGTWQGSGGSTSSGGTSTFAGAGGTGPVNGAGGAGTAPAGGGGGAGSPNPGTTSGGQGARGEVRVWTFL